MKKLGHTVIITLLMLIGGSTLTFNDAIASPVFMKKIGEEYLYGAEGGGETGVSPGNENSEAWMCLLVNYQNPVPKTFKPRLKSYSDGLLFDERAIDQLNAMISDARAQGLSPVVCSAYRTYAYQKKLYNNQVLKEMSNGLSREEAEAEARKTVSYPGTSEHNIGLAVDICSSNHRALDAALDETAEIKWLMEHCSEYGFIMRYPKDKTEITGIIYEPWHYRYVGVNAAEKIMKSGQCLEEYLDSLGK